MKKIALQQEFINETKKSRIQSLQTPFILQNLMQYRISIDFLYIMKASNFYQILQALFYLTISLELRFEPITSVQQHTLSQVQNVQVIHTSSKQILKINATFQVPLLTVPDGYQFYDYSSGYSCIQSVFSFFGFPTSAQPYRQDFFINQTDIDQNNFVTPQKLVQAAINRINKEESPDRRSLLSVTVKNSISNAELQKYLDREIPVILLITKTNSLEGVYVVATGYDASNYYFEDPFTMGDIGYLPKNQLSNYWKALVKSDSRLLQRSGIVIEYTSNQKRLTVPTVRPLP